MRCVVCGLPTVPMGGEGICLSDAHARGYEDDAEPEYERELQRADQQVDEDLSVTIRDRMRLFNCRNLKPIQVGRLGFQVMHDT